MIDNSIKDYIQYQIFKFKSDKEIVFGSQIIFIIDIYIMKIVNEIKLNLTYKFSINNYCYLFKDYYNLLFLRLNIYKHEQFEGSNLLVIKIDENFHKILLNLPIKEVKKEIKEADKIND